MVRRILLLWLLSVSFSVCYALDINGFQVFEGIIEGNLVSASDKIEVYSNGTQVGFYVISDKDRLYENAYWYHLEVSGAVDGSKLDFRLRDSETGNVYDLETLDPYTGQEKDVYFQSISLLDFDFSPTRLTLRLPSYETQGEGGGNNHAPVVESFSAGWEKGTLSATFHIADVDNDTINYALYLGTMKLSDGALDYPYEPVSLNIPLEELTSNKLVLSVTDGNSTVYKTLTLTEVNGTGSSGEGGEQGQTGEVGSINLNWAMENSSITIYWEGKPEAEVYKLLIYDEEGNLLDNATVPSDKGMYSFEANSAGGYLVKIYAMSGNRVVASGSLLMVVPEKEDLAGFGFTDLGFVGVGSYISGSPLRFFIESDSLKISLFTPRFSEPVDVYAAVGVGPSIYSITDKGLTHGIAKLKSSKEGLKEDILKVPLEGIPEGCYDFYVMVVPEGEEITFAERGRLWKEQLCISNVSGTKFLGTFEGKCGALSPLNKPVCAEYKDNRLVVKWLLPVVKGKSVKVYVAYLKEGKLILLSQDGEAPMLLGRVKPIFEGLGGSVGERSFVMSEKPDKLYFLITTSDSKLLSNIRNYWWGIIRLN